MVEGMSAVLNVMLYLMSVMSPPHALCFLSVRTVVTLCTLGVFALGVSLVSTNCDDICMCVVNKQFELREFVFDSVYLTCSMMRFISLLLLGLCPCGVSVVMWMSFVCMLGCRGSLCRFGGNWTVIRVLLFVIHVCMLR